MPPPGKRDCHSRGTSLLIRDTWQIKIRTERFSGKEKQTKHLIRNLDIFKTSVNKSKEIVVIKIGFSLSQKSNGARL